MGEIYYRSAFKTWLNRQNEIGDTYHAPARIDAYVNALKYSAAKLSIKVKEHADLFACDSVGLFDEIHKVILTAPNYEFVDTASGSAFSGALKLYRQFLTELTTPACWILSVSPEAYDLPGAVRNLDTLPWRVGTSDRQIKKTDRVFLMSSGPAGGIVAAGTVISGPEEMEPAKNDPYVIADKHGTGKFTGIVIQIDRKILTPMAGRDLLLADEQINTLTFVTAEGAAYYAISADHEAAILQIIENLPAEVPEELPVVEEEAPAIVEEVIPEEIPAPAPVVTSQRKYWVYAPEAAFRLWEDFYRRGYVSIDRDFTGDLRAYATRSALSDGLRQKCGVLPSYRDTVSSMWQFANEMNDGDILYVRNRASGIVGRGIVRSEYTFDDSKREYRHVRAIGWTNKGEWPADPVIPARTLTDITSYTGIRRTLESQITGTPEPENLADTATGSFPAYTKDDFLSEVFIDAAEYARLRDLLRLKKNVILTGAPGVGKTFTAERLAYSMIGEKNPDLIRTVRFHPGYRYEDFVMDKPSLPTGTAQSTGVFYEFCREAEADDRDCFFIIDDMDRGDIGRIFGELLALIENTRRGTPIRMAYRDEEFSIPENVYLIGTMTSPESAGISGDRSFHRRFSFFHLEPAFDSDGFRKILNETADEKINALVRAVITLNREIAAEPSLGESFRIGHSYFLNAGSDIRADALVEYDLLPLISSYRQADPAKIKGWTAKLRTAVK